MQHDPDVSEDKPIGLDRHGKWIIGVVSAALVTSLGYFVTTDKARIEERIMDNSKAQIIAAERLAVHEYRLNEQDERLERMEKKLDQILDRLPPKRGER